MSRSMRLLSVVGLAFCCVTFTSSVSGPPPLATAQEENEFDERPDRDDEDRDEGEDVEVIERLERELDEIQELIERGRERVSRDGVRVMCAVAQASARLRGAERPTLASSDHQPASPRTPLSAS